MPGHRGDRPIHGRHDEAQRLLVDLEANTSYHSFPRPKFAVDSQRPTMSVTKAEQALQDVLQAYPTATLDHAENPEEDESIAREYSTAVFKGPKKPSRASSPHPHHNHIAIAGHFLCPPPAHSVASSHLLSPTQFLSLPPAQSVGPSSPEYNSILSQDTTRPNSPIPQILSISRPRNALSTHSPPQRVYSSPLDTLASTRLHIIEHEQDLRPYELRYRRKIYRVFELVMGAVLLIGIAMGVGGALTIGIGEGDLGGLGLWVRGWARVLGVVDEEGFLIVGVEVF